MCAVKKMKTAVLNACALTRSVRKVNLNFFKVTIKGLAFGSFMAYLYQVAISEKQKLFIYDATIIFEIVDPVINTVITIGAIGVSKLGENLPFSGADF